MINYGMEFEAIELLIEALRGMSSQPIAEEAAVAAEAPAAEEPVAPPLLGRASWTHYKVQRLLGWSLQHGLAQVHMSRRPAGDDDFVPVDLLAHHMMVRNWDDFQWDTADDVMSLIALALKGDPERFESRNLATCDEVRYVHRSERGLPDMQRQKPKLKGKGKGKKGSGKGKNRGQKRRRW